MSAPTLLLLSGNMCDERLWLPMLAVLRPENSVTSIVFDREASIDAMAARVLAAAVGPIVPIGFSMGAIVALDIARVASSRLAGIALLGCNPAADLPERAAQRPRQQVAARRGGLTTIVTEELKPNYFAAVNAADVSLRALVLEMALALGPDIFVNQSEALLTRRDLTPALAMISSPAFVATGAEDRLCPPEWHRRIAAAIPAAELHIIDGAGHLLPLEQPAVLAMLLGSWLARLGQRRSGA